MNLAQGPLVVIPEPIRIMNWDYDAERSMLEPLGIRLLVPETAHEARASKCARLIAIFSMVDFCSCTPAGRTIPESTTGR